MATATTTTRPELSRAFVRALALVPLAAGLSLWVGAACSRPARDASLLADTGGPIELVAVSVNSARRAALANAALVEAIVNALDESTRVVILTNDREAFTVARDPVPDRVAFLELPADTPLTIWPQDPFLVLRGRLGATRLLASKRFDRAGDAAMARALGEALGLSVTRSELVFEGGNLVSNARHVFVGENTVRFNARELGVEPVEVVARLEAELGRSVLVIGPTPQPVPHIDMMLTPLGDDALVLADSRWGAAIAEEVASTSPDALTAFERSSELDFFGDPAIHERLTPDGTVLEPPALEGATKRAIEDSRALGDYFDALAASLAERGYEVHRMPILLSVPGDEALPEDVGVLDYPVMTYNNALVEERAGRKRVYIPRYGLEALDAAARRQWRELGYDVTPVDGFTTSALYGGALRCSVKVLRRGDDTASARQGKLAKQ